MWPIITVHLGVGSTSQPVIIADSLQNQKQIFQLSNVNNVDIINVSIKCLSIGELKKLSEDNIANRGDVFDSAEKCSLQKLPDGLMYAICSVHSDILQKYLLQDENYFVYGDTFKLEGLKTTKGSILLLYRNSQGDIGLYPDLGLYNSCADNAKWLFVSDIEYLKVSPPAETALATSVATA
ncbi:MAG: hypothetical protein H6779_03300 [Candidatus Nomurabacteria bacterium]|nr:MAG: hypothetical protein H6779_03300 [Candidatus Nomurabacteria bacterium]